MTGEFGIQHQVVAEAYMQALSAVLAFDTRISNDYKCAMLYDNIRLLKNYNHKNNSKSDKLMRNPLIRACEKSYSSRKLAYRHEKQRNTPIYCCQKIEI